MISITELRFIEEDTKKVIIEEDWEEKLDNDEITGPEEAFLRGYNDAIL